MLLVIFLGNSNCNKIFFVIDNVISNELLLKSNLPISVIFVLKYPILQYNNDIFYSIN